jgi:hypothetical protein
MMRRGLIKLLLPTLVGVLALAAPVTAIAKGPSNFSIPPGWTLTFSNVAFGACNQLTGGYVLDGVPHDQWTFGGGCTSGSGADFTIAAASTWRTLRVYLRDDTCGVTYYSDGSPVDHVMVDGSNVQNGPLTVRFGDAGGFCERAATSMTPFAGYNFKVTLTRTAD